LLHGVIVFNHGASWTWIATGHCGVMSDARMNMLCVSYSDGSKEILKSWKWYCHCYNVNIIIADKTISTIGYGMKQFGLKP